MTWTCATRTPTGSVHGIQTSAQDQEIRRSNDYDLSKNIETVLRTGDNVMAWHMLAQEELEGWEKCNYTMCSDELLNRPPRVCWSLDKGTDNILLRDGRRQTCFSSAARASNVLCNSRAKSRGPSAEGLASKHPWAYDSHVLKLEKEQQTIDLSHGNPNHDTALHNLVLTLNIRYDKLDASEDLDEAIDLFRDSLQSTPHGHPCRHTSLFNLSLALCSRFTQTRKNEDVEELHAVAGSPLVSLRGAGKSADLSLAVENFRVTSRHPTRGFADRIKEAIDWACQAEVYHHHDSALEAYQMCLELIDNHAGGWDRFSQHPITNTRCSFVYVMMIWDKQLNFWSRVAFLLPPSYADLQVVACHGPVIILVASQHLYSAIIVPTSGNPRHVSFPCMTITHLEVPKKDFAREIRCPEETRKELQGLLRTVWDEIMLPVVVVLQCDLRVGSRSRIWLCPSATFTSIPLHAAHSFRMKRTHTGTMLGGRLHMLLHSKSFSSRQMMKTHVTPSFAGIGQSEPGAGQGEAVVTSQLDFSFWGSRA
ncbi:hypothetical protein BDR07DRAFT_1377174 [Suillus spraguei]|nr:hypothetical protein BDR07DRAFT_1377174 [Suillus spraguei]